MMTDAVSHQKSEESTFEDVTLLAASITGHAFSRKGFLCRPHEELAMYTAPKSDLATVLNPDGATCVFLSTWLEIRDLKE